MDIDETNQSENEGESPHLKDQLHDIFVNKSETEDIRAPGSMASRTMRKEKTRPLAPLDEVSSQDGGEQPFNLKNL